MPNNYKGLKESVRHGDIELKEPWSFKLGDTLNSDSVPIKQSLADLGLYSQGYKDVRTYTFDAPTAAAVSLFQKKVGLPQTGIADETTNSVLYDISAAAYAKTHLPDTDATRDLIGTRITSAQETLGHGVDISQFDAFKETTGARAKAKLTP